MVYITKEPKMESDAACFAPIFLPSIARAAKPQSRRVYALTLEKGRAIRLHSTPYHSQKRCKKMNL